MGGFVETYTAFGSPETLRFDVNVTGNPKHEITDSDGEYLESLPCLIGVNLNYTNVGDSMLAHLSKIKSLRFVCIEQTKATSDGIKNLQRHLPKCKIYWENGSTPRF